MACYHPISGWRDENGRVTFTQPKGSAIYPPQKVKCGHCFGCKLEYGRQWAVRCMHEASLHDANAFLTLTYDDEHLPEGKTLVLEHWQKFARRVRKRGHKFRFYHCGEYGEKDQRPHYHALLFGLNFHQDRRIWKQEEGLTYYRSPELESLWTMGNSLLGDLTYESASYVARYAMKKVNGGLAAAHYGGRRPEYSTMSRRPGIAADWIRKYETDVYPDDFVVTRGRQARPPRYYDEAHAKRDPLGMEKTKKNRRTAGRDNRHNTTPERLAIREQVARAKGQYQKREL